MESIYECVCVSQLNCLRLIFFLLNHWNISEYLYFYHGVGHTSKYRKIITKMVYYCVLVMAIGHSNSYQQKIVLLERNNITNSLLAHLTTGVASMITHTNSLSRCIPNDTVSLSFQLRYESHKISNFFLAFVLFIILECLC